MCLTGCGGTDPAHAIRLKVVYGKTKDAHPHAARRYVSANRVRKKIHKNNETRRVRGDPGYIFAPLRRGSAFRSAPAPDGGRHRCRDVAFKTIKS